MVTHRLSQIDWLDGALARLAQEGHGALRAERLAASMGVSRGSFYWHFTDVAAFEQAVLDRWETIAVDRPYSDAMSMGAQRADATLRALVRAVFNTSTDLERAVRSWAATSPAAADAVTRVDQRRVELLNGILSKTGADPVTANARAVILYWTYLGHVMTAGKMRSDAVVTALIEQLETAQ